jgi:hypothetical protein
LSPVLILPLLLLTAIWVLVMVLPLLRLIVLALFGAAVLFVALLLLWIRRSSDFNKHNQRQGCCTDGPVTFICALPIYCGVTCTRVLTQASCRGIHGIADRLAGY